MRNLSVTSDIENLNLRYQKDHGTAAVLRDEGEMLLGLWRKAGEAQAKLCWVVQW